MYVTLICFIFTAFILVIFGNSFTKLIDKSKKYSLFDSYFIGLCLVGTILNFWSLFFPTNHISFLFLLIISSFIVFKNKFYYKKYFSEIINREKKDKKLIYLLLICTFTVLLFSIVTPRLYDTYLYHINAIQWNEFYKTVPGLANLHERFGFNSSLFVLSAGFSFKFIYEQYLFIINSLSYLIFLIWILKLTIDQKNLKSLFLLLFIYYFTNQYFLDISSPGSDLLPNIFLSYLLINIIFFKDNIVLKPFVFIVLPLFCITLKLSSLPIVLLSIISIMAFKEKSNLKKVISFLGYGSLFVLPWIIRNIIISGYILYPMPSIDLFNFDWKVPVENAQLTKDWVYSWGRIPFKDCKEVLNLSFNEWFSVWWKNTLLINKRFIVLAVLSPFIYLIYSFFNKNVRINMIPVFTALIILILWFFTAPDIRFSFSIILFLALSPILLISLPKHYLTKLKPIIYICTIITLFLIIEKAYSLFEEDYKHKKIIDYSYLPIDVSTIKEKKNIQFNSIPFKTNSNTIYLFEPNPRNTQCFDKFPCSWYIDGNLKLRGDDLTDGFYYSK